jgi:hypothetical protein
MTTEHHVKILFEIEDEGSVDIESLWAVPVPGGYRLDNIPFYAREVACYDVVAAVASDDGALRFSGLFEPSGHSTVRIVFESEHDVAAVRETLRRLGCGSELGQPRFLAVDVPPEVPYAEIRAYLDEKESAGVLEYEESCLGQSS